MNLRHIRVTLTGLLIVSTAAVQGVSALPATAPPGLSAGPAPAPPAPSLPDAMVAKVEAALDNAWTLRRSGQIGIATVWDGNKFVQCRRVADGSIWCEAAGPVLQPSLAHVITLERAYRLFKLGWQTEVGLGNYVRVFPGDEPAKTVARQMLRALDVGYGADLGTLEVRTAWMRDVRCPPRNGPGQNLAGSIDDAPAMAPTAIRTCDYAPAIKAAIAMGSVAQFLGLYGQRVKGEIERLIVNSGTPGIHLVLTGDKGYVQCEPESAPPAIYCEAASADAVPALAKVLTPDHVAELHTLGFADPGRSPNYSRSTPLAQADAHGLTLDLLTMLFDIYGYRGFPVLSISTEKGN